jgi:hypothetical protein
LLDNFDLLSKIDIVINNTILGWHIFRDGAPIVRTGILRDNKYVSSIEFDIKDPLTFSDPLTIDENTSYSISDKKLKITISSESIASNFVAMENILKKYQIKWDINNVIDHFLSHKDKDLHAEIFDKLFTKNPRRLSGWDGDLYAILEKVGSLLDSNKKSLTISEILKEIPILPGTNRQNKMVFLKSLIDWRGKVFGIERGSFYRDNVQILKYEEKLFEEIYDYLRDKEAVYLDDYPHGLIRIDNVDLPAKLRNEIAKFPFSELKHKGIVLYSGNSSILLESTKDISDLMGFANFLKLKLKDNNMEKKNKETKIIESLKFNEASLLLRVANFIGDSTTRVNFIADNKNKTILFKDAAGDYFSFTEVVTLLAHLESLNKSFNFNISNISFESESDIMVTIDTKLSLKEIAQALAATPHTLSKEELDRVDRETEMLISKINIGSSIDAESTKIFNIFTKILDELMPDLLKADEKFKTELFNLASNNTDDDKTFFNKFIRHLQKAIPANKLKNVLSLLEEAFKTIPSTDHLTDDLFKGMYNGIQDLKSEIDATLKKHEHEVINTLIEETKKISNVPSILEDGSIKNRLYSGFHKHDKLNDKFEELLTYLEKSYKKRTTTASKAEHRPPVLTVEKQDGILFAHADQIVGKEELALISKELNKIIADPDTINKSDEQITTELNKALATVWYLDQYGYDVAAAKKLVNKKEPKVVEEKSKFLTEAESAVYRIGARKISKATSAGLASLLKKDVSKKTLNNFVDLLETDFGKSLTTYLSGAALSKIGNDNPQINKLSDELRVEGMLQGFDGALTKISEKFILSGDAEANLSESNLEEEYWDEEEYEPAQYLTAN